MNRILSVAEVRDLIACGAITSIIDMPLIVDSENTHSEVNIVLPQPNDQRIMCRYCVVRAGDITTHTTWFPRVKRGTKHFIFYNTSVDAYGNEVQVYTTRI